MKSRWIAALIAGLVIVAAATASTASADESQTPVATGCPAGYERLQVSGFPNPPYRMPRMVDAAGNGNGYVCALRLPEDVAFAYCQHLAPDACALYAEGLPLYNFVDDDNPASKAAKVGG